MARYAPLLSVEVAHDYFASPERLALTFRPDGATRTWLERTECVIHAAENRLQILYDADAVAGGRPLAQTGETMELRFGVSAEDPLFTDYTDGLAPPSRPPLILGPDANSPAEADGAVALRPLAGASPWAGPRVHAVLSLPLAGDLSDAGRAYRARLAARETRWKYILLDDWGDVGPCVVDTRDGVVFGEAEIEALADGRRRLTIRSQAPLPIRERCDRHFQLRASASGDAPGAILIGRLPGAAPGRLALDSIARSLVTEIYVAR